jgi:predicted nucleic acid-binding protein
MLAVCTNEPSKPRLIKLTAGAQLIAPVSVHWEVGNALSAMMKRKRINLKQAQACVKVYQKIPIKLIDVNLTRALALSERFRMYAYDAYLLVCATENRSPLITLDGALKMAAQQMGISILGDES